MGVHLSLAVAAVDQNVVKLARTDRTELRIQTEDSSAAARHVAARAGSVDDSHVVADEFGAEATKHRGVKLLPTEGSGHVEADDMRLRSSSTNACGDGQWQHAADLVARCKVDAIDMSDDGCHPIVGDLAHPVDCSRMTRNKIHGHDDNFS